MRTRPCPKRAEAGATEPEAALRRGPSFTLVERLHAGSITGVWRAELSCGDVVALKALRPELLDNSGARELLRREHRVLQAARHPNVVAVRGFFDDRERCAIALELHGGGDLVPFAGARTPRWLDAAVAVSAALAHVHAAGFVHGDVKARNVLLGGAAPAGAKLVDFGSAAPIGSRLSAGGRTPEHEPRACGFAAELAREGRATPAQDVYAFAVLLYELMAGRLPRAVADNDAPGQGLRAPLRPFAGLSSACARLADEVVAVLTAQDSAGVGTLLRFANVLESVRSERNRDAALAAAARGGAFGRLRGCGAGRASTSEQEHN